MTVTETTVAEFPAVRVIWYGNNFNGMYIFQIILYFYDVTLQA